MKNENKQQLLSDQWDNVYLNEAFHESLLVLRNKNNGSEKDFNETQFFRETPVFLIDHPTLSKYNTDALIVNTDNEKKMVFVFKQGLVEELNKYELPESSDVVAKVTQYVQKTGLNAMNNVSDNNIIISKDTFVELLQSAKLDEIVTKLGLSEKSSIKPKM